MAPAIMVENARDQIGAHANRATMGQSQRRPEGPATILGIGTAVPPFVHEQSSYPDYYFDETNCSHKTELKAKFKRMCDKMQIKKRHMVARKELLKKYPSLGSYLDVSLNDRHEVLMEWIPKLAVEASENAIAEWGGAASAITHIVMATTSVAPMPGLDLVVANALGLAPSLRRVMMYQTGCWGGAALLRVAKDMAENNRGARVLVVSSECTTVFFRAPNEAYLDGLVGQGLFGDGAAAAVVGADPVRPEDPLFSILASVEMVVPGTMGAIDGHLMEAGMYYHLSPHIPTLVSASIEAFVTDARGEAGNAACNDLFWAVHPGGAAVLDQIETQLALLPAKLRASREILAEYGNMASACVLFVLDRIRKSSVEGKLSTTGEGKEFGLLIGIGPGITMECCVLKAMSLQQSNGE